MENNVIELGANHDILKRYIDLERKVQRLGAYCFQSGEAIDPEIVDDIRYHLSLLKISLESLEEEGVLDAQMGTIDLSVTQAIDARKIHLIASMEKILSLLGEVHSQKPSNVVSIT